MTTVTPPPPHSTAPSTGGVPNTTATIPNPPQALLNLQVGQSLSATLTGQLAPGQVQVDTPFGPLTLQTALNLPRGAALTLIVTTHTPQTTVQITAKGAGAVGTPHNAQTPSSGVATPAQPPITAGQPLTVTLVRPALGAAPPQSIAGQAIAAPQTPPQASQTPAGAPQATSTPAAASTPPSGVSQPAQGSPAAGTPSSASAPGTPNAQQGGAPSSLQAAPPAPGQASSGQASSGQASSGQTTAPQTGATGQSTTAVNSATGTPSSAPSAAAAGNTVQGTPGTTPSAPPQGTGQLATAQTAPTVTLAAGTRFNATVQRVDAPGAAVVQPTSGGGKPLAQGMVLSGTAAGRAVGGQPIVQTPAGAFALGSSGALSDGAKITFRLDSPPLSPLPSGSTEALHGSDPTRDLVAARGWNDMLEALKTIAAADPARLSQVAQNALPQPGAKLTSQMLFLLSALKGGDLRSLFGDTTARLLETERPELAARLGSDFQTMSRLADEPQSGDWRLALIPLWSEDKLQQLRLFWRHGGAGEDGDEGAEETRFVVDLDLTHLGHLQIDGLVKPKRHHLDLILRTDSPLPETMRAEITEIFESARELVGLGGQVGFQTDPPNFIAIPTPAPQGRGPQVAQGAGLLA